MNVYQPIMLAPSLHFTVGSTMQIKTRLQVGFAVVFLFVGMNFLIYFSNLIGFKYYGILSFNPGTWSFDSEWHLYRYTKQAYTLFSYSFVHYDIVHLITNMFLLVFFATPIASLIGPLHFCIFYVSGALLSAMSFAVMNVGVDINLVGASGVASAFLGAYIRLRPAFDSKKEAFSTFLPLGETLKNVDNILLVMGFVAANLMSVMTEEFWFGTGGSSAWEAHVSGFLFGLLACSAFDRKSR